MEKKHEVLPVVLAVVTACAILIAAVLIFMDAIMRTFAPGIYVGGRLLSTYNNLEKEAASKDSFFSGQLLPSDNLDITFDGNLDGIDAKMSGQYDRENQKIFLDGTVHTLLGTLNTQFFSEDGESGIALPDFKDVWLCAPNNEFLQKLDESGFSNAAGISLPHIALFPQSANTDNNYSQKLYPVIKSVLEDIKTDGYAKKGDGIHEYRVYAKGENVKTAMVQTAEILLSSDSFAKRFEMIPESGEFISSASESLKEYIEDLTFPETVAFTVSERNKSIVAVSTNFTVSDGDVKMWADMSEKARLSDSVKYGLQYDFSGSTYGISYASDGNHFFRGENLTDNTKIEITLPFIEKTTIEKDIRFTDNTNFDYDIKASNDTLFNAQFSGNGKHSENELTLSTDKAALKLGDKDYSIGGSITLTSASSPIEIPSKEKYSIDSLSLAGFMQNFIGKLGQLFTN